MGATDVAGGATTDDHGDDGDHAEHEHRSKWPLVAAIGAAALYIGFGLAVAVGFDLVPAPISLGLLGLGVLGFLAGIAGWTYEAFLADYFAGHGFGGRESLYVAGMYLFLVSDVATFLTGFVYYAFIRVGMWPPADVPHLLGPLVIANTGILVVSSFTLHYAHEALEEGNRSRFLGLLGATLLLGVVFLAGQVYEYYEFIAVEGFTFTSGLFASAFYGLTGLHGLHVTLGVVLIALTMGRALRGAFGPERDTSIRTVSLYWHFVDVVWVFLVIVVYVGGAPSLF